MLIKFSKESKDIKTPERANPSDAGFDLFAPEDIYLRGTAYSGSVQFPPANITVDTGIKMEIPHGYMLEIKDKSSIASQNVIIGACVIDSGYSGNIKVNLINLNRKPFVFKKGEKIAQAVLVKIEQPRLIEADEEDLYADNVTISNRGEGGFGSTGSE